VKIDPRVLGDNAHGLAFCSGGSGLPYFSLFPMEGYFFLTARLTLVFSEGVPNCETRDKAFFACASFSIGYFRLSGSAKDFVGRSLRAVVESFAMVTSFLD
jgi:hypothetical protein